MYNKVVILFNKNTKEILTIIKLNKTNANIDNIIDGQIKYNDKFNNLTKNLIGVAMMDKYEYEKNLHYNNSYIDMYIDKITNQAEFDIQKRQAIPNKNRTYADHEYKRTYSLEQVKEMYYEDYINFNLRNAIKNGVLEAKFIPIKDLNIRPRITQRTWKYFVNDPYLKDTHDDKLKLGRSIMEIGTWYPFVVAPMIKNDDKLFVFEGNHRIISLKLLAMYGELSEDFKVMCLVLPTDYYTFKEEINNMLLPSPIPYRYIIEDVYGCDILVSDDLMQKTLQKIALDGENMINNYTVEATGKTVADIMSVIHAYPLFLRDLIYLHNSKVVPSKIINNENEFNQWLNK